MKWRLILYWNSANKTIHAGKSSRDIDHDELGAWSICKRTLTRRWTSQIRGTEDAELSGPDITVGGPTGNVATSDIGEIIDPFALLGPGHPEVVPSGVAKVAVAQPPWLQRHSISSDGANAGGPSSIGSSTGWNSGVMVEEERPNWLQELGSKGHHLSDWTKPLATVQKESKVEHRRTSSVQSTSKDADVPHISIDE